MTPHLTIDELDAFATESPSQTVASHLATCSACAEMVAADGRLLSSLARLSYFDPAPDFANRVMAGVVLHAVERPSTIQLPTSDRARSARRRAIALAATATAGIAAGFAWAAMHPAQAVQWSSPALQNAGHTMWLSFQTVVANATEHPWFAALRDSIATPARGLLLAVAAAGIYGAALTGLRRVMSEPVPNARW